MISRREESPARPTEQLDRPDSTIPGKTQKQKKAKQRVTLKEQHFEAKNGLRSLYQKSKSLKLTSQSEINIEHTMKKIVVLLKTWHFQMIPKYSFDYFLQRCNTLGTGKRLTAYMAKIRNIHKGLDQWQELAAQNPGKIEQNNDNPIDNPPLENRAPVMNTQTGNRPQNQEDEDEDDVDQLMKMMERIKKPQQKRIESEQQIEHCEPQGYDLLSLIDQDE